MTLPVYDPLETCQKCGGENVLTEYHGKPTVHCPCWDNDPGEHLARICTRCGYVWLTETKDALT